MRRTKIICTLGPSSSKAAVLKKLVLAGMNVARLNFSHGTHKTHRQSIDIIRRLNKTRKNKIKILLDLEGYRIRVGLFKGPRKMVALAAGSIVTLINKPQTDKKNVIPFDYEGSLSDIKTGCHIFIDDGNIALKVKGRDKTGLKAEVIVPGFVKEHKGVNIPDINLKFDGLTDKDKNDLLFGIANKVDFIAQSFVRSKKDILSVREFVNRRNFNCPLIAKIENRQGIENIDQIMEASDGIMIARGDMGVSLPIYEVPVMQKMIIKKCLRRSAFVITATQMLESMTEHIRPTRAEVSDIANAIIDGSDYVMLSAETAAGKHPVEAAKMTSDIISFTEKSLKSKKI
ncbi:MAG: pyruvate kinase [Phycisphaerae bacterium]|nr:pyruvate kinase [Phycisphaerae bacterium]MDD5380734.1 pyruvate kinase [Phycisphaerae bacterium]